MCGPEVWGPGHRDAGRLLGLLAAVAILTGRPFCHPRHHLSMVKSPNTMALGRMVESPKTPVWYHPRQYGQFNQHHGT
jgi:hypothetical protein